MVSPSPPYPVVDRLEKFRDGTFRIDILRRDDNRFSKVAALDVDPSRTDDIEQLSEQVYACAVHHAEQVGRGGQYRMMLRRKVLHEKEKRVATFEVETWYEQRQRERAEKRERRKRRTIRTPLDAQQLLLETRMDLVQRDLDLVVEMDRVLGRSQDRVMADLAPFVVMYEAALRLTDEAASQREQARVEERIAAARRKGDEQLWAAVGPLLETVMECVRKHVEVCSGRENECTRDNDGT